MFHPLLEPIARELSGRRAWLDVSRLWHFRNTVCTPSLRQACRYCVDRFKANGIAGARIIPYKADGKTTYGQTVLAPEWECTTATLRIVAPPEHAQRLTSFEENALAIMDHSAATPKQGVCAELVVLDDGTKPEHYKGLRVRGKIVLTARQGRAVAALAKARGAIGIISDTIDRPAMPNYPKPMREGFDAPDAVQWNTLSGTDATQGLFGFVLSPRVGARLRELAKTQKVVLEAHVDARSFAGHSDVVDAVVKGSGNEELWVLAHISEPGAYDNASGLAVSIEIARTLNTMVRSGVLPPMRRSVRFLFSTEVSGFMPYLEQHRARLARVVAGLCIDSVGVDMGKVGGEFVIFRSPDYAPSYIEDLLAEITEAVVHMRSDLFGDDNYALFPWRHEPFWGNDAFITDPYFDVPTAQLSCWPYPYYHTSQDMPQYVSPDNLARTGVVCATFLHVLACAAEDEACWLSALTAGKAKTRIADALRHEVLRLRQQMHARPRRAEVAAAMARLGQCREYHAAVECARAGQPATLAKRMSTPKRQLIDNAADTVRACADDEARAAAGLLCALVGQPADLRASVPEPDPTLAEDAAGFVPVRTSWRPRPDAKLPAKTRHALEALRQRPQAKDVDFAAIWPWADGRRTVLDVWRIIQYKQPCDLGLLMDYFRLVT